MSSRDAFEQALDVNGESTCLKITSSGSAVAYSIPYGNNLMISVKTTAVFVRWGNSATTVTDGTAASQGMWWPSGALFRITKPPEATHLIVLQDGSAGIIFISPGNGV